MLFDLISLAVGAVGGAVFTVSSQKVYAWVKGEVPATTQSAVSNTVNAVANTVSKL